MKQAAPAMTRLVKIAHKVFIDLALPAVFNHGLSHLFPIRRTIFMYFVQDLDMLCAGMGAQQYRLASVRDARLTDHERDGTKIRWRGI
jgi:hypothetical protein